MRPKTLGAALAPCLCAYGIAIQTEHQSLYFYLCLGLALSLQIATNFYNDAVDFKKGADENRVGPARITTQMQVPFRSVMLIGHLFLLLSLLLAIPLFVKGGPVFVILGLLSLFLAYGYTGGPFPLAYLGLGELFVFLFFGLVASMGCYFLMTGSLNTQSLLMGCMVGFISSALIAINNLRDRDTDREVGKRTLATRLSHQSYLILLDVFLFMPFVILLYFGVFVKLSYFLGFLSVGLAHRARYKVRHYSNPLELNQALALAGKLLVLFSLLFFIGSLWQLNT